MIALRGLSFAYPAGQRVFESLDLSIEHGSSVAIMGPNGSGKTTLACLLKGLNAPTGGELAVDGILSDSGDTRFEIMRRVGLVFQNPENTMVGTTVETELAFGLENLGIPRPVMHERVDDALERFDLARYRHTNPSHLSGGEKQRLALASVMVMNPAYLVLDEPTALLDQPCRRMVLSYLHRLADEGATVIHITQFLTEAAAAGRVIVLGHDGTIMLDGSPGEVLPKLEGWRTCVSQHFAGSEVRDRTRPDSAQSLVTFENAGFVYEPGTPFAFRALEGIFIDVPRGYATVVLGPSGSGKTTLLELAAGLEQPTDGAVTFPGKTTRAMAFQLPEDQMSGDTVAEYVAFAPLNAGLKGEAVAREVDAALTAVGLDPTACRGRDPFALSGGDRRLAAIAGVMAVKPDFLVLDEPAAGLDRAGMERMIICLTAYLKNGGTLLFSTHDAEVAHALASYALVLDHGRVESWGAYREVLERSAWAGLHMTGGDSVVIPG